MDSNVSEEKSTRVLRRSTRQLTGKALNVEPTPRGPLQRTNKRRLEKQVHVNGSGNVESGSDDKESPSKKNRRETGGGDGDGDGDGDLDDGEMDVQESDDDLEKNDQLGMDVEHHQPKIHQGALGEVNLHPCVVLGERCPPPRTENEFSDRTKTLNCPPYHEQRGLKDQMRKSGNEKTGKQTKKPSNKYDVSISKVTSMDEYKRKMEVKPNDTHFNCYITSSSSPQPKFSNSYPASEKSRLTQRVNNIPTQEKKSHQKNQEGKKKTAAIKKSSGHSFLGFMQTLCYFLFLVLICAAVIGAVVLIMPNISSVLQRTGYGAGHPLRSVKPETFADQLSHLETQFLSQRPELWKRSSIHLGRHLSTAQPTEPVSMILTAGRKAEKTLQCLAQGLASAFSSALNASVLHIDGASKASQDSDEVKLDIDKQLQAAFEGDKPVAIIHRLEELPPGSTLIFYRYCDHENAAYKRVFLLFTVLLPEDEVRSDQSLKSVEEKVQDYVKGKLVGSSDETGFNAMDIDKFGGLWSRISHLILPVVSETEMEQKGCP
ncbi:torsin-1A-interacting protein 2-like isoform X2 [Scomber japonicus]|uniref:torsin-1A-interacting protein 2-like isoform X2 n=1 Tax=Scomber japonicus TaxID=13676 RepID=UPI0023061CA8|nr:torsin-1A-interacting protein 2-like isoform X2 [Scomber japonicus]